MMPTKWERADSIWTYPEFDRHWRREGLVMFVDGLFKGRAVSGRVVANMSYALVTYLIMQGRIHLAQQTEEYRGWLRDELLGKDRVEWWMKERRTQLLLAKEAGRRD